MTASARGRGGGRREEFFIFLSGAFDHVFEKNEKNKQTNKKNACLQAGTRLVAIPAVEGVVVLVKARKGCKVKT